MLLSYGRHFFLIFKGNTAIKGEQSFMCGTHCLDLRNINFYKISSRLFDDKRKGPCHIVSFFQNRHITNYYLSYNLAVQKRCVIKGSSY